jgi:hypothetical protein
LLVEVGSSKDGCQWPPSSASENVVRGDGDGAILVACSGGTAWAQVPTRIAWTQAGAAQTFRFMIFIDGVRLPSSV